MLRSSDLRCLVMAADARYNGRGNTCHSEGAERLKNLGGEAEEPIIQKRRQESRSPTIDQQMNMAH